MMEEQLRTALDHAMFAGASYADARAVESESETISVTGPTVEALDTGHSIGFGVRVLAGLLEGVEGPLDLLVAGPT